MEAVARGVTLQRSARIQPIRPDRAFGRADFCVSSGQLINTEVEPPAMILTIACLVIGIIGFAKGRINISKTRELRGGGMYAAATLLCLPLPLSFGAGFMIGLSAAASHTPVDNSQVLLWGALCTWVPILASLVIGYSMARPKVPPGLPPRAQGFEVQPVDR
jgi:hypothetical protein